MNAKQAALYLQINEKTLYRLIQEEKMPALKLGREWRFKKTLLDEWLTGKMQSSGRSTWLEKLLQELKSSLVQTYGDRFREAILYGSAARGEMRRGSDVDVAVVLSGLKGWWEELRKISLRRAELSLKYDVTVSLHFIDEDEWKTGKSPLIENIRKEGVVL